MSFAAFSCSGLLTPAACSRALGTCVCSCVCVCDLLQAAGCRGDGASQAALSHVLAVLVAVVIIGHHCLLFAGARFSLARYRSTIRSLRHRSAEVGVEQRPASLEGFLGGHDACASVCCSNKSSTLVCGSNTGLSQAHLL